MATQYDDSLLNELQRTLQDIDMQIKHIKNDIKNEYPEEQREKINVWFWTRYPDGLVCRYCVLADLLVARADCLSAMARLRASRADAARRR
ncbi:MAG TPA: hypothetical protein PKD16_02305 [Saprospiraceae bacterium]|jgi:hypothetical protein|nr:hypothetical protein [Saprospiraceae bacterium]